MVLLNLHRSAMAGSLVAAVFVSQLLPSVDSHGYMGLPVSRQFADSRVFKDKDENECPHCYNSMGQWAVRDRMVELVDPEILREYGNGDDKGLYPPRWAYEKGEKADNGNFIEPEGTEVRHGVCGDPKQKTNEGMNEYSLPNSNFEVFGSYIEGQIIEIKIVVTYFHAGHFEFRLCNAADLDDPDGVVTTQCLQMHHLSRAPDDGDASPIDPDHPGRYYPGPHCRKEEIDQSGDWVGGGHVETMRYKLPDGLTCSHCILQWVHYTGHKCRHLGYEEFNPPSWPSECAPNKSDWIYMDGKAATLCGDDEWSYPEEFWSCADIEIKAKEEGGSEEAETVDSPDTPAPADTELPTTEVQPAAATEPPVTPDTTDDDCMAVVIEAEDIDLTGAWMAVSDPDAIGGKYIVWEGLSQGQNTRDPEDGDIISTTVDVSTPGTYRFKWRMRQPSGVEDNEGNDSWLNFPDATRFGPVDDSDAEYGQFIKVYGRASEDDFEYSGTAEEENHGHTQIAVEFERAGQYTMELAGRSHGHQIDQIVLYAEALDVDDAAAGCPA